MAEGVGTPGVVFWKMHPFSQKIISIYMFFFVCSFPLCALI